jgi:FAD/FMN-containing dehydrogenase
MKTSIANWGNYPVLQANEKKFSSVRELTLHVRGNDQLIARGNGRSYGDASLAEVVCTTLKFNKFLSFDKTLGILECEAGLMLDKILEVIIPAGWFLPVTPGTKFITVGGAVASDVHGKNHHVDGCFCKYVSEMDVLTASGEVFTTSREINPDLFKATVGGMGLTGVITRVQFHLKPITTAYIKQKKIKASGIEEIISLFEQYNQYTYSVAWIDCLKGGKGFGRSILMLGEHAQPGDLNDIQRKAPLKVPSPRKLNLPFFLPSFLLNNLTVSLFNFFFYHKMTKKVVDNVIPYEPFFYPLDAVTNWNRGYGKNGFVQYQFVIPLERKDGLIALLEKISKDGHASFLAVLKVFGEDNSFISFPMKGFTLAMDFPVHDKLFSFLDELDEMVIAMGGRIYLSKDARMKPSSFIRGYANADEFLEIVKKYNPGKFNSLLSQRLELTS